MFLGKMQAQKIRAFKAALLPILKNGEKVADDKQGFRMYVYHGKVAMVTRGYISIYDDVKIPNAKLFTDFHNGLSLSLKGGYVF